MRIVPAAVALVLVACGPKPRDLRVEVPAAEQGLYDIVTPEQIIPAGKEIMFCTDVVYTGDDAAFWSVDARQGKFGHHVILLGATKPRPEGTTYDCSSAASMKDLEPFAIMDLPEGSGTPLAKGKAMVIQMHYVNTSQEDLLVRDVIRLGIKPRSEITRWVAPMALGTGSISVPPRATGVTSTFDCTVNTPADLILLVGHMHERGASFKTELGPDVNHLTTRYQVDAWKADYRDAPPAELFMSNPLKLTPGMVVRTTCTWDNDSDRELRFPEEMCASFGLIAGVQEPWVCKIGLDE